QRRDCRLLPSRAGQLQRGRGGVHQYQGRGCREYRAHDADPSRAGMIATRHLSAMILALAVACGGSPPPYQERTLPSGQTVKVLGVGKMFFTKGDAALM